jgi:hypothetical protein
MAVSQAEMMLGKCGGQLPGYFEGNDVFYCGCCSQAPLSCRLRIGSISYRRVAM